MCQTRGSKADGSSEGGVTGGGDRRKGKGGLMTKVMDWKDKKLKDMKPTDIRINFEGFTLSEGLIFKAKFDVRNPLSCAIPKWKSIRYSLKIADNLNFPDDSDREIAKGEVPSKWLKAKETTTVYVTINVSLENLGDKLKEIVLQTIINGLLKVELEISISFPIMGLGGRPISHTFPEDVPVSLVLENCLSPPLYKLVQVVLDTIEGNKNNKDMDMDILQALFKILEALSHYCDDKMEALDADDMKKNLEQIKFTIESIKNYLNSQEFLADLKKNWEELKTWLGF